MEVFGINCFGDINVLIDLGECGGIVIYEDFVVIDNCEIVIFG